MAASTGHWIEWLRLGRISAVPTAISNVLLGYLLATQLPESAFRWEELLLGILASSSLYIAGMMLNDVFDIEQDRIERPERPLPSGKIRLSVARAAGISLLISGVAIAGLGSWCLNQTSPTDALIPFATSVSLALAILAYDGWLKQTFLAPALMGLCRLLNLLLGASFALPANQTSPLSLGFDPAILFLAAALGIYVSGITLVGRKEALVNVARGTLWLGTGLVIVGITGYAFSEQLFPFSSSRNDKLKYVFPWIILLLAFPVVRCCITAALSGTPRTIQTAVVSGLRGIIVFDAALCFLAAPQLPGYAVGVLSLLIPSLILNRWLKAT